MAIKIQSLEIKPTAVDKNYTYKDLSLDITQTQITSPGFKATLPGTDIKANYDLDAINNSLVNLFTTIPGQRFLFPEYGADLYRYLFEPINESVGRSIGQTVYESIKRYERRVTPRTVSVIADTDNNEFRVTALIDVPILGISTSFNITLDTVKQSILTLPLTINN